MQVREISQVRAQLGGPVSTSVASSHSGGPSLAHCRWGALGDPETSGLPEGKAHWHTGHKHDLQNQTAWVQSSAPPLASCVT